MSSITLTTSLSSADILSISPVMSPVAPCVCSARFEISDATTANPRPASPALAASILAFNASRLVCDAILLIRSIIDCILPVCSRSCPSSFDTFSLASFDTFTHLTSSSIFFLDKSSSAFVSFTLSTIKPEEASTLLIVF